MDLKEQRYVCTLAECQNLTRAAERLFISQPALSIFISKLENSMGMQLFTRTGGKFLLSFAGECYVEEAKKMLELERSLMKKLDKISSEQSGRIRIGASVRRSPWLLPPVIARFEKEWPDVEVILQEGTISDLNELLDQCELDLMVLNLPDLKEGMDYQVLFSDKFLLAVPQLHPINEKSEYVPGTGYRRVDAKYLNGETLFLHASWSSSRHIEDRILEKHRVQPGRIRVIRGTETSFQMIAEGLGIGFIRESYAINLKYRKQVNYYSIDSDDHPIDVVACYRSGHPLPKYTKKLLELLTEHGRSM